MPDINQLIESVTPSNTVNSINIYKVDYLPNIYVNPRKIKGRKYNDKYVLTDHKIGQLKIKQFVSSTLKSYWGLVSKAVKIKNTISLNTENDKYMFIKNASKEDLKKIKYDNYFGIRVSNTDLYDFDRRMVYHDIQRDSNENDVVMDMFMGSGSTGVACLNTNRKFIGIELDDKYFEISKSRLNEAVEKKEELLKVFDKSN